MVSLNSWKFDELNPGMIYYLNAGKYYIGDITYAIQEDIFRNVFRNNNEKAGLYQTMGGLFLVGKTCENGTFTGTDNYDYEVDSGSIGIVSESLLEGEPECGRIYEFPEDIYVIIDDGKFTFEYDGFYMNIDTTTSFSDSESETEKMILD